MIDLTPVIIAEACCNHMGKMKIAKKMILEAKRNGADYIKFQKRNIDEWVIRKPNVYKNPHQCKKNSFGKTYEEHRRKLEFSLEQHKLLKNYCDKIGINYCCSVFDIKSAMEIVSLSPKMIKVPSACNTNFELLSYLCNNFSGEIHVSFGMTSKDNIEKIVSFFVENNRNKDLIIYACTSAYPLKLNDVCLNEISYLKNKYSDIVKGIGYSGHHIGIVIDISAYTLGAKYIERHFTLDKNMKGTDQKASIVPKELFKLKQNLTDISQCLQAKSSDILQSELQNEVKLKW